MPMRIVHPAPDDDIRLLAALLVDAVDSGEPVSFMAPLALDVAEAWWRRTLTDAGRRGGPIVLVERDEEGIVASVQLHPAWAPNQPHRAEVTKLIVHRRARRRGLGERMMLAIEDAAAEAGFHLLTLDARRGGAADHLYRKLGWTAVGTIPRFAVDPDGRGYHDAVIFYKALK